MACTPSEDFDQPGHPPGLIKVFTVRMKKAWSLATYWVYSADSDQTDLSPRWAHSHFVGFVVRRLNFLLFRGKEQKSDNAILWPFALLENIDSRWSGNNDFLSTSLQAFICLAHIHCKPSPTAIFRTARSVSQKNIVSQKSMSNF